MTTNGRWTQRVVRVYTERTNEWTNNHDEIIMCCSLSHQNTQHNNTFVECPTSFNVQRSMSSIKCPMFNVLTFNFRFCKWYEAALPCQTETKMPNANCQLPNHNLNGHTQNWLELRHSIMDRYNIWFYSSILLFFFAFLSLSFQNRHKIEERDNIDIDIDMYLAKPS